MNQSLKKILPRFIVSGWGEYRRKQLANAMSGSAVYCEVCGGSFTKFLPHGLTRRPNAKCPGCGALERHRLQLKYLKEKTNVFDGQGLKRMLHFAPERSLGEIFAGLKGVEYVPCDLFPDKFVIKNAKLVRVDITEINFPNDHFDVILCSHVLEHIPDDDKAMRELNRVLRPGGIGILQAPIDYNRAETYEDFSITDPKGREKAFGQNDHVRWYGRDYPVRLRRAGFSVIEDDFVNRLSAIDRSRLGVQAGEILYCCTK